MPLLSPAYSPYAFGATFNVAPWNTPMTQLYALVNGGGTPAGIDSTNINSTIGLNFTLINPGTLSGNVAVPTYVRAVANTYWSVATGTSPVATLNPGDVQASFSATTGKVQLGAVTSSILDFNTLVPSAFSFQQFPSLNSFNFAMQFYPPNTTSAIGAAMPAYTAAGANVSVATGALKMVYGVAQTSGATGAIINLLGAAQFTSNATYSVVASQWNYNSSFAQSSGWVSVTLTSGTSFTIFTSRTNGSSPNSAYVAWLAIGY
jgi:hypothetical protein